MLSTEKAGQARSLDFLEEEQQRGITIQASNVNMVHEVDGKEVLINLIDTPGHVDFGGDVTRAMRAVDGALVVVCAVEGAMPQTETVLRQALKERVKPVLFINKVDRLIQELKITPEAMQERFTKIINSVNDLIRDFAPPEFKKEWQVSVNKGTVAFGSSVHKWAVSVPVMQKKGLNFKDIYNAYSIENEIDRQNAIKELEKRAPLHEAVLDMVANHLPSPVEAQKYRIPRIWKGDINSAEGKALLNCDEKGPLIFCVTKVVVDPQAGEIAVGRVFSGTLKKGMKVHLMKAISEETVQQIYTYKGNHRFQMEEVPAGNIVGIGGLKHVSSGETISSLPKVSIFEDIKHLFEPVVTKSIEAKNPKDLPKLIKVLRDLVKEDPTIRVQINEETGEHLLSGLGELHLEIKEHIIERDKGVPIITSKPIVVYRETVTSKSPEVEGKSPNKHNKFYITVEPLESSVYKALSEGEVNNQRVKKKNKELWDQLIKFGLNKEEARGVSDVYDGNILLDMTKGVVHIKEVIEMVMTGFEDIMRSGPVAREPCAAIKIKLNDCKLHEDSIHRGPGQVIPAIRQGIKEAILQADYAILEPVQTIRIDAPAKYMGGCSKLIQSRRGRLLDMQQEGNNVVIKAKLPVAEMFGFTSDLRSETEGRGYWSLVDSRYERLPRELQDQVIKQIRSRKGLSENQ